MKNKIIILSLIFVLIFIVGCINDNFVVYNNKTGIPQDNKTKLPPSSLSENTTTVEEEITFSIPESNYHEPVKCHDPNIGRVECNKTYILDANRFWWLNKIGIKKWDGTALDLDRPKHPGEITTSGEYYNTDAIFIVNTRGNNNSIIKFNIPAGGSKTIKFLSCFGKNYCFRVCETNYGYDFDERWIRFAIENGKCDYDCSTNCRHYSYGETIFSEDNGKIVLERSGYGILENPNTLEIPRYAYLYAEDKNGTKNYPIYLGGEKTIVINNEPYCVHICDIINGIELYGKWAEINVTRGNCEHEQKDQCNFYYNGQVLFTVNDTDVELYYVKSGYEDYGLVEFKVGDTEILMYPGEMKTINVSGQSYCIGVCEALMKTGGGSTGAKLIWAKGKCPE